jgi:hypothetical protein
MPNNNHQVFTITNTAPRPCCLLRIADSAFLPKLPHTFHTRSCRSRCRQRDCSPQHRPCPYPCLRPCCRRHSAAVFRSRRSVAAVRHIVVAAFGMRKWVVEPVVQVVASRTNAVWTSAASRWLEQVVRKWCLTARELRLGGSVAPRRVSVACSLYAVSVL